MCAAPSWQLPLVEKIEVVVEAIEPDVCYRNHIKTIHMIKRKIHSPAMPLLSYISVPVLSSEGKVVAYKRIELESETNNIHDSVSKLKLDTQRKKWFSLLYK